MHIVKNRKLIQDRWKTVGRDDPLPSGDIIVPLARWQDEKAELLARTDRLGIQINGDDRLEDLIDELDRFDLIALEFPKYTDGRSFSTARLLRDRYGYKGELRAVGDVLRDQIFYMERCGIDSYVLRSDQDPEQALKAFDEFSVRYQSAADHAAPIEKIRQGSH